jgi:tRNA-dihydrouridine synthase B
MVTSDTRLWNSNKSRTRLTHYAETGFINSVQIAGYNPEMMANAAQECVKLGADVIDINMGCPAKKVCNTASGSALLRDKVLVKAILSAVVSTVSVPVTLKFRTGWSPVSRNAVTIAKIAEEVGISAITLHGRSKQDAYRGFAEYETIRHVKTSIQIPIIANGDIQSENDIAFILRYTQADGIMLGRASWGQPWIFKQLSYYLRTGEQLSSPTLDERLGIVLNHVKDIHSFYGTKTGVRIARKHIGWYLDRMTLDTCFKKRIFAITNPEKQLYEIKQVFLHFMHT